MGVVDEVDAPAALRQELELVAPPQAALELALEPDAASAASTAGANSRTVVVPASSSAVAVSSRRPPARRARSARGRVAPAP